MTLIAEYIDIPTEVHKSDFVISLEGGVHDPARTLADYVVTDQLAACFDRALSLVTTSVTDGRSKGAYLHASFGAGKSHLMAVLHLLLQGDPRARALPELGPVVARYSDRLDGRKFLLVPYHFIGATSMEQVILGGYVRHVAELHPSEPPPAVYVADGILADAVTKRTDLGDDVFFRVLSEGETADEWGDYGAGWDAGRFESALAGPAGSSEHDLLIGALLRTHYRAVPGQAQATAEGFVPLDAGLAAVSRHAKGLGYDAVVLFLDELVLWLASRMSDHAFVTREGSKVAKLVEADAAERPAPIVSFIARQRDLRELVGEQVPGAEGLNFSDVLRHWEGRFDTITLEDRNLPAIAKRRLLRPRDDAARQAIDDAFEQVRREVDERQERDVLLTATGDLEAFRQLYPFSPALVDALVALSGAMQRERTALKVMLQLLVDSRDHLELGQLVPVGDLFDAINAGDEPLTEVMRNQFAQARRLWLHRFLPVLRREHGLTETDDVALLAPSHPFTTDARLVKTLLVAALVPEVAPLRGFTVSRLTALNSGVVRVLVPGSERQQVLEKLRRWAAEVGELRLGDDEQDPTVSVVLSGIDTGPILDGARVVDNEGERRRKLKELLHEALQVQGRDSLDPWVEVTWRGTRRRTSVVFANIRDDHELPDEMLRATATEPKLVIDFPYDLDQYSPSDDRARVDDHRRDRPPEWTACWLPNFLTASSRQLLGKLVRLDYALTGDTFETLASYLSPTDRAAARTQLANEQSAVRERVLTALRQAYGVDRAEANEVDSQLDPAEQFPTLDPGLVLQPPVGTSLRACLDGIVDQLYRHRFPKHPLFTELVSKAELQHTLDQVLLALQQTDGRLENVDAPMRRTLTKVAGPLGLGTMHAAHFVANVRGWVDLVDQGRAMSGAPSMTVGQVRQWIQGTKPAERRGLLPEMADVVILVVAAATNRVLVSSGQPVTRPELGRLRDDWDLRAQALPDAATWHRALERAMAMGVVAASNLLSATTVADLSRKLHDELIGDRRDAMSSLVAELEATTARLYLGEPGDRLRTARAAVALAEQLRRRPDAAVEVLADADVPTTAAALGTSIKQARGVADELHRTNWELLGSATSLPETWAIDAESIASSLCEGVQADELAVPLAARLVEVTRQATGLLRRAASATTTPPRPPVSKTTNPAEVVDQAEHQLAELRERLRTEADMDLTWTITPWRDADHS